MTGTIELSEYVIDAIANAVVKKMQEPYEDTISRKAIYEQIHCWIGSGEYRHTNATDYLRKRVANLPGVQPKPKTGYWIIIELFHGGIKERWYECSKCDWSNALVIPRNYCPNCGAKMIEPQESEDKE